MENENPIEMESLEAHSEQDEKNLLDSLGDNDNADFDPSSVETPQQKADLNKALLAQGAASVVTVLGVTEQLMKQFGHKDFVLDPSQVDNVANAAAPLFVKYGGEMPPWMAVYKDEIMFTMAAGSLCFTSFAQIRMLKASDKAKDVTNTDMADEGVTE